MPTNRQNNIFRMIPPQALFLLVLLVVLSIACNLPIMVKQAQSPGFVATSVAETMIAFEGDQPPAVNDQSGGDDAEQPATLTFTPEISDTPSLTPTATVTPTPEVAMVYASANTNCRTGQGTFFEWLVTLQKGESAEAVGIDTSGEYWYIHRPDQANSYCWLWGKYATPSGPYESLPVYTPIPTPTPGFDYTLAYREIYQCGPWWGLQFQINNTGSFTLESWKSTGVDNSGGLSNSPNQQDSFFDGTGCSKVAEQLDLTHGEGSFLNAVFFGNPTGHNITVTIKVCTKNGLAGDCLKKEINVKP